jgi:DNA-binding XRE family transcriptional regulator
MSIGTHVLAWRRHLGLTQEELVRKTGLTRLSISKLERGEVDPSFSTLRKLASAFGVTPGTLVDELPPSQPLTRKQMNQLARAAISPGTQAALRVGSTRSLSNLIRERRKALGVYRPRKGNLSTSRRQEGVHAARWLRASLGDEQWKALLNRIDKLASAQVDSHEST